MYYLVTNGRIAVACHAPPRGKCNTWYCTNDCYHDLNISLVALTQSHFVIRTVSLMPYVDVNKYCRKYQTTRKTLGSLIIIKSTVKYIAKRSNYELMTRVWFNLLIKSVVLHLTKVLFEIVLNQGPTHLYFRQIYFISIWDSRNWNKLYLLKL